MQGYRITGGGYKFDVYCYVGRARLPNVTVHGPIKYALEKGVFYIQDEDGQEFKLSVMEKSLIQSASQVVSQPASTAPVASPPPATVAPSASQPNGYKLAKP
jgi:hypothetical protein